MAAYATSFELEASKFLQDGFYNSDLGNTMPLAMANALQVSFVAFTSSPVFIVSPREPTNEIVYVAHTYTVGQATMMVPSLKTEVSYKNTTLTVSKIVCVITCLCIILVSYTNTSFSCFVFSSATASVTVRPTWFSLPGL